MYYVYGLICPIDKKVKYVGKTKNIKSRYSQHKTLFWGEKGMWALGLSKKKLKPILKIFRKVKENNESERLEVYYINKFFKQGIFNRKDTPLRERKIVIKTNHGLKICTIKEANKILGMLKRLTLTAR